MLDWKSGMGSKRVVKTNQIGRRRGATGQAEWHDKRFICS